jgi:tetratricopeptide (TPR) repeat protein
MKPTVALRILEGGIFLLFASVLGAQSPLSSDLEAFSTALDSAGSGFEAGVRPEIHKGIEAFESGRYTEASRAFFIQAEKYPLDPRSHLLLCFSRLVEGEMKAASGALVRALSVALVWRKVPLRLPLYVRDSDELRSNLNGLESSVAGSEPAPEQVLLSGFCDHAMGRSDRARNRLESLVRQESRVAALARRLLRWMMPEGDGLVRARYPSHRDPKTGNYTDPMTRGYRAFSEGRFSSAARSFCEATLQDPDNPIARIEFCQALFAIGHYQLAGRLLRRAILRFPSLLEKRLDRHAIYSDPTDFLKHQERLASWIETHPQGSDALWLYGFNALYSGHLEEARLVFLAIRKHRQEDRVTVRILEQIEKRRSAGEEHLPVPDGPRAGEEDPTRGMDRETRLRWCFENGHFERAREILVRWLQEEGDPVYGSLQLARAEYFLGRFDAAGRAVRNAMDASENWKTFTFDLSNGGFPEGVESASLARLRKYVEMHGAEREPRFFLAVVCFFRREYLESRGHLRKLYARHPSDEAVAFFLLMIQQEFDRSD